MGGGLVSRVVVRDGEIEIKRRMNEGGRGRGGGGRKRVGGGRGGGIGS